MSIRDFAERAASIHRLTGGSSTCPTTGTVPGIGYMVGVKGHEETVPADEGNLGAMIEDYIVRHAEALLGRFENPRFVGTWEHGGLIYLDVSEQFLNFEDAYQQAQRRGERALYAVVAGEEVRVAPQV